MNKGTVLVSGATGLLGPYLVEAGRALGSVVTLARHGADVVCDLSSEEQVADVVARTQPSMVLHAAALTDVEACERDEALARASNEQAVAHLASALAPDANLLVVSTDQVYPDVAGPHSEDRTGPVNAYGRTKLAGERAALSRDGRAVAVRVNFFGPSRTTGRRSLSDFFVDALGRGEAVNLFDDLRFSPLHLRTVADLLVEIADRGLAGVFNAGSSTSCTKAEFALMIADRLGLSTASATICHSSEMPGRTSRARDLSMDVTRLEAALGRSLPDVKEEVSKL